MTRNNDLRELLTAYQPLDPAEAGDVRRTLELLAAAEDPFSQAIPLHLTASALVVHPPSGRVLLRWHARANGWLHIGGHGDPGETDALEITLREGREETGLDDLRPWPDDRLVHVSVVPVAAKGDSPAHEHADLRFVLATDEPDTARPEKPDAPLRWLTLDQAMELTTEASLRELLLRAGSLLTDAGPGPS